MLRTLPILRKADIVQIEQPILGLLLAPFIQKVIGKPVALDCHDVFQAIRVGQTGPIRRIMETFLEKIAYKNADVVLTVSETEKQLLIASGVEKSKIFAAPNGVDTVSFQKSVDAQTIRKKYGFADSKIVVFVGNLSYLPNREAMQLISSTIAPKVNAEIPGAKFVVVGKKPTQSLSGIYFTGFVDSVADVLKVSDVGIAPLLHGSGTRLKILEYFSSGIPVVSTSVGAEGIEVKDGENIFIADKPEDFAAQITKLLKDNALSFAVGQAGRELAERYDWKKIVEKLGSDYQSFLAS